ncbi:energy transducer TonB [Mucilaginibacter sp. ZT4R22]|uniref:Energy transducer TonB n=1 Tax=Mucilaginibacter pankratovii TaxID=2772110 RepID=A0ABR7WVJ5_9SPHI|nr:energy transducer TonB [Mucilaginibacter pankratovii]MBD1366312.1 energy transducer TonB [Mucilaginibacter pankratovii]
MNWLHYLVEANIYLGVFYLCYCLFLNNETHYLLGRAYLLFSCVVSFVLPITQLSVLKPVEQLTLQQVAYTQQVNYGLLPEITIEEPVAQITMGDVLFYAYIAGAIITLSILFYRLYRLSLLTRKSKALYGNKYKLIQLNGDNTAFSFFNYLFIGTEVPQAETIIAHELVHIRQGHSADIIFVELIKVVSWFSPFIYLVQRSLRSLHEYIADEQTAAQERDALTYSSFLLNNAYGIQGSPIAHSFFNYNLLKKRIIMLNQKRSGSLARLKYLAAVPLCVGMLCASTLVFSKDYAFIDLAPATPVQAEISIDEPITKTIKYFKIIDKVKDITAYSDNLSFTDHGVKKTFFAKSTSAADIAYIEKTMKLTVEVIDVDSKTKNPVVIFPDGDAKVDTNKRKLFPPPPPYFLRKPYDAVSAYLHKTIKFPAEALKAKENGAVVFSFELDAAGKINNIKVLQSKGAGYEAVALKALQDYPYPVKEEAGERILEMNFWLPDNQATYLAGNKTRMIPGFVGNIIFNNETSKGNIPNLPPPPPPARPKKVGAVKGVKVAPPVVVADVNPKAVPVISIEPVATVKAAPKVLIDVKPVVKTVPEITIDPAPAKAAKPAKVKPIKAAPPVVVPDAPTGAYNQDGISDFTKELARTIRYPVSARNSGVAGKVMLRFSVTDNKVSNVLVMSGVNEALEAEAKRALENYRPPVNLKSGFYFVPVSYAILKGDKYVPEKKSTSRSSQLTLGPTKSLNEVVVVTYM